MTQNLLQELQKHPFVGDFKPEQVARLAEIATQVRFESGQVIFHEGEAFGVFYLLSEGMVALELESTTAGSPPKKTSGSAGSP